MANKKTSTKGTKAKPKQALTADIDAQKADAQADTPKDAPKDAVVIEDAEILPADIAQDGDTVADVKAVDAASDTPTDMTTDTAVDAITPDAGSDDDAHLNTDKNGSEMPETPPLPAQTEQVVIHKGGFFPLLLGGLVAGAIGFGVSQYFWINDPQQDVAQTNALNQIKTQASTIQDLNAKIDALPDAPDLSPITDTLANQQSAIGALVDRIGALEDRPVGTGTGADLSAYDGRLKTLQAALEDQRAVIDDMSDTAAAIEQNAQASAQATLQRAALTRIQTALDSGSGFAPALADLESTGADVPAALRQVAVIGVPSLADLTDSLPDAARAALKAARSQADASGEQGGFTTFLRRQLGVRSLEPQAGTDPDAVLSRIEAATRQGRLTDALAEIEGLPEVGRVELSDWSGQVARRLDAVAAAQALSDKLN